MKIELYKDTTILKVYVALDVESKKYLLIEDTYFLGRIKTTKVYDMNWNDNKPEIIQETEDSELFKKALNARTDFVIAGNKTIYD